jgi:hypothetical protein
MTLSEFYYVFDFMDWSEQIISHWKTKHPDKKEAIHDSFQYLRPTEPLHKKSYKIYKLHCDEIINRIIRSCRDLLMY